MSLSFPTRARLDRRADDKQEFSSPLTFSGLTIEAGRLSDNDKLFGVQATLTVKTAADLAHAAVESHSAETGAWAAARAVLERIGAAAHEGLTAAPEFAAVQQATEAHATAVGELRKLQAERDAAKASLEGAIEQGRDPRPFRPALVAADEALGDVQRWVEKLNDKVRAAEAALHPVARAAEARARDRIGAEVRAQLDARRARVREEVRAVLERIAPEVLELAALEWAVTYGAAVVPRRPAPVATEKPIEQVLLDMYPTEVTS